VGLNQTWIFNVNFCVCFLQSKHHNEKITHRKSEELSVSRSISTSKSLRPDDEDDDMDDKHHGYESTDTICKIDNWSSDENGWDKGKRSFYASLFAILCFNGS